MLRLVSLLILIIALAACSKEQERTQVQVPAETIYQNSQDVFLVKTWVNKPNPSKNELVTVYGSLLKNGIHLGGMMMQATWPDPDQERGSPNCNVLVIYQTGVCTIEAAKYPAGEFLPITVIFNYEDAVYKGETGFTP
jgi:hypothetical protein